MTAAWTVLAVTAISLAVSPGLAGWVRAQPGGQCAGLLLAAGWLLLAGIQARRMLSEARAAREDIR